MARFVTEAEKILVCYNQGQGQPKIRFADQSRGRGVLILMEDEEFDRKFTKKKGTTYSHYL